MRCCSMVLYKFKIKGERKAACMYIYYKKWSILRGINRRKIDLGTEKWEGQEKSSYRQRLPENHSSQYKESRGRKEDEISPLSLSRDFKPRDSPFPKRTACFSCSGLESNP